ncbi:hypothetical protein, partial [Lactobacillus helveticus]
VFPETRHFSAGVVHKDVDEVTKQPVGEWKSRSDVDRDKKADSNFAAIKVDPIDGYPVSATKNGQ